MKTAKAGIGEMRQRLTFQKNMAPRNASGGFGENWQTVATVWGNFNSMDQGHEFFHPEWTTSVNAYVATIRRRSDITESMQILFGTRVFKIRKAPQVDRSDRFMNIICEEVKV